jgi:hypothetical protein
MANGRRGDATLALLRLADEVPVFDLDAGCLAVYGRHGTQDERNTLSCLLWKIVREGKLIRKGRGKYASPTARVALPPPEETRFSRRFNRIVAAVNVVFEEVSELRHDLDVAARFEDSRPSFPMRAASPWEREP